MVRHPEERERNGGGELIGKHDGRGNFDWNVHHGIPLSNDAVQVDAREKKGGRLMKKFDYPKTAIEALKIWDKGEWLDSIEMGGLGANYEHSIQFSVFELIRHFKGVAPKGNERVINKRLNDAISKIDRDFDIGHSGASAGAAMNLAFRFMKDGYEKTMKSVNENRHVPVEKELRNFEKETR